MLANSASGQLGSATAPLKVFQDFFADIDLPLSLTANDRVEVPVAVYNYLAEDQTVTLTLEEQPWFKLDGPATQTIRMAKNEVKAVSFPITVVALGRHTLKVTARGSKLSDAVVRSVDVLPDGKEIRRRHQRPAGQAGREDRRVPRQRHCGRRLALGQALPRRLQPGGRGPGWAAPHAVRLLRADQLLHLPQRPRHRLPEGDQEGQSRDPHESGGIHQRRLPEAGHLRVQGRRLLLVRRRARPPDPDRLRTARIQRHGEGPRGRPRRSSPAPSSGSPDGSRRTARGRRTVRGSPRASSTGRPAPCAAPPTSPGRWPRADTPDPRSTKPSTTSGRTAPRRRTPTRSR